MFDESMFPAGMPEEQKAQYRAQHMEMHSRRSAIMDFVEGLTGADLLLARELVVASAAGAGDYWCGYVNAALRRRGICPICGTSHGAADEHAAPVLDKDEFLKRLRAHVPMVLPPTEPHPYNQDDSGDWAFKGIFE